MEEFNSTIKIDEVRTGLLQAIPFLNAFNNKQLAHMLTIVYLMRERKRLVWIILWGLFGILSLPLP